MTLPEAIREAGHDGPIRRRSWLHGFRIQWSHARMTWVYGSAFEATLDPLRSRTIDLFDSQVCITPGSIVADDWELAT